MNQDESQRQMDMLTEDARQHSVGRRIAGISHTNTITTVYKDGGGTRSVSHLVLYVHAQQLIMKNGTFSDGQRRVQDASAR